MSYPRGSAVVRECSQGIVFVFCADRGYYSINAAHAHPHTPTHFLVDPYVHNDMGGSFRTRMIPDPLGSRADAGGGGREALRLCKPDWLHFDTEQESWI